MNPRRSSPRLDFPVATLLLASLACRGPESPTLAASRSEPALAVLPGIQVAPAESTVAPAQSQTATAPSQAAPADEEPLPEGLEAWIGRPGGSSISISADEYSAYLRERFGSEPLRDLIYERLLSDEAATTGIDVDRDAIASSVEAAWDNLLQSRARGDLSALQDELRSAGFSPEAYRARMLVDATRETLENEIVLAQRQPTEAQVQDLFERRYGPGGERRDVRHLLRTRARTKAERITAGDSVASLSTPRLDQLIGERIAALLIEVKGGADFAELARIHSHDQSTAMSGGLIQAYNGALYGPNFAQPIKNAAPGELLGPIQGSSGIHLAQVESVVVTELTPELRAELLAELMAQQTTPKERYDLRLRLLGSATIRMAD